MSLPQQSSLTQSEQLKCLEAEIALLEQELFNVESDLNLFEHRIRTELYLQIGRIKELKVLYKNQKGAKKAKRLEQKKKGKNFKESFSIKKTNLQKNIKEHSQTIDQQELKRLYKEAIVLVHPDKFVNADADQIERSSALTVRLNEIYRNGDFEELKDFHEHIISGNALSHKRYQPGTILDSPAMLRHLLKKKEELVHALTKNKESHIFKVLKTYPEPLSFIRELKIQFEQHIIQLENRTRTRK